MGDVRVVEVGDAEYPARLAAIDAPPVRLWVRGLRLEMLTPCVAVVGTRTPTPYGEQIGEDLAADLAAAGIVVVSGLARGIDGMAHRGALRPSRGRTIAVLGTGIDVVHPRNHAELAASIAQRGALVTEYPPGTPGLPSNFRNRNSTIAALSLGVVVVQGVKHKSGALITAARAKDYDRTVFAVPGNVDVEVSSGPHELLRTGAALVASAGDVLRELEAHLAEPVRTGGPEPTVATIEALPPAERVVLGACARSRRSIETIALRAGLPPARVASAIVRLELSGYVARLPGGGWRRVR